MLCRVRDELPLVITYQTSTLRTRPQIAVTIFMETSETIAVDTLRAERSERNAEERQRRQGPEHPSAVGGSSRQTDETGSH
jgi:hypothetical protein